MGDAMSNRGMTLIELLIALVIVILVLAAAFLSFSRLFQGFKSQTKISESHISSLIGIELLRKDLEMAGLGVPVNATGITYSEAAGSQNPPASDYNDNGSFVSPFSFGNNAYNGADYLVIRSVYNPEDDEAGKWAYFVANNGTCGLVPGENGNFSSGTKVVVEDGEDPLRAIQKKGSGADSWKFSVTSMTLHPSCPDCMTDDHLYLVYGIRKSGSTIRMPFNRVDYYLKRPSDGMPARCASSTYELYRAFINHDDGRLNPQPVLDCVRDFQVAFFSNSTGWAPTPPSSASNQKLGLKEVRVFVLYQEGQKEREALWGANSTVTLGDSSTGTLSTFSPSGDDAYYRWRVKELVVKPMNLGSE